jgi:hypothetical protein
MSTDPVYAPWGQVSPAFWAPRDAVAETSVENVQPSAEYQPVLPPIAHIDQDRQSSDA